MCCLDSCRLNYGLLEQSQKIPDPVFFDFEGKKWGKGRPRDKTGMNHFGGNRKRERKRERAT